MRDGLMLWQLTGGYSAYAVTRVGWVRRVSGDEWEVLPGSRVLWRKAGVGWDANGLAMAAKNGPGNRYNLSTPAPVVMPLHRLLIRQPMYADADAWAKECPMPKDWVPA